MLALAAIPSSSVALVVARSSSLGFRNGVATTAGIVAGDLIFVTIAIMGMSALAIAMGSLFSVFKYAGGAYLIWLGIKLLGSKKPSGMPITDNRGSTLLSSFSSGLLLTLGDLKAVLFYASLFPALMDLSSLSIYDITIVISLTIVTVGGVKLIYAIAARTIVANLQTRSVSKHTKSLAGGLMVAAGSYIIIKA